jgi:hypothetical protein
MYTDYAPDFQAWENEMAQWFATPGRDYITAYLGY